MKFKNNIFRGKINNKCISNYKNINYKITELDKRLLEVTNLLEMDSDKNFFIEYFDNYFNVNLAEFDELSENNNICTFLESLANYILGSNEVRSERKNSNFKYRFFIDKSEFKERTKKEDSLHGKMNNNINGEKSDSESNIINFLLKSNNNKLAKAQIINNEDLEENSFCGQTLRNYKSYLDFIDKELLKIKLKKPTLLEGKRYILTRLKKDIYYDMIYCKTSLKGTFGEKLRFPISETTVPSLEKFDWHEESHIKQLLFMKRDFNPNDDISFLVIDLENIIEILKINKFTKRECTVIEYIKLGYSISEIKDKLMITQQSVSGIVKNIVKKIQDYTLNNFKI